MTSLTDAPASPASGPAAPAYAQWYCMSVVLRMQVIGELPDIGLGDLLPFFVFTPIV